MNRQMAARFGALGRNANAVRVPRATGGSSGQFGFFYVLAAAVIAALITAVLEPNYAADGPALLILGVAITWLGASLFANLFSKDERPAELFYIAYMLFYYAIPGLVHIAYGRFPFYNLAYPPDEILRATAVVLLFVVFAWLGYRFSSAQRSVLRPVSYTSMIVFSWICLILALLVFLRFGFEFFQLSRGEEGNSDIVFDPVNLILAAVGRCFSFLAAIGGLIAFRRSRRLSSVLLLLLATPAFLLLNNPLSIPRFIIAAYLISAAITFFPLNRSRKTMLVLLLVIGQFTVFPALSAFQRGDISNVLSASPFQYFRENGDFDGMQSTINVVDYTNETGLKAGHNLLSAVLFFVPRAWWPTKSGGTGGEAATFIGYRFNSISSPLPAEFYVDFGWLGVLLGGLIVGFLLRRCDETIRRRREANAPALILPYALLVGWLFILLRGSLVAVLGPVMLTVAATMLLTIIGKTRAERRP